MKKKKYLNKIFQWSNEKQKQEKRYKELFIKGNNQIF